MLPASEISRFADAQMASEAFLRDEVTGQLVSTPAAIKTALTRGNGHASRFTDKGAERFSQQWQIIDHVRNTTTGFSGTLLLDTKRHEYVLSIRSTEFIDDAARDSQSTNDFEIKSTG